VQVHYDEGVANHIGPEPCAGVREGVGEASAGERIGQPLSRESYSFPGADAFVSRKATLRARNASARTARRGLRPWHVRTLLRGNREISWSGQRHGRLVRIGKARSRSR
jgi:hypothetical protein